MPHPLLISQGLISCSYTIRYVPIGLLRLSLRVGLDLTWSSRSGSPNWDYLIRANTFRYVHHEPMQSVTIAYDCGLEVFHDHDRGWSWFELRLDPDGYIYSWTDHGLHLISGTQGFPTFAVQRRQWLLFFFFFFFFFFLLSRKGSCHLSPGAGSGWTGSGSWDGTALPFPFLPPVPLGGISQRL